MIGFRNVIQLILVFTIIAITLPFPSCACTTINPAPMHQVPERTEEARESCAGTCSMRTQTFPPSCNDSVPRPTSSPTGTCPFTGNPQQTFVNTRGTPGRISGIRRIYQRNVLDHPERAAVYKTIETKPGIDLTGIADNLGMNRETLRYHLNLMESFSKIVVMRDHGIVRYYENHGRYGVIERNVILHLWNPTANRILSFIGDRPGITQSEIAKHLAITAPTVRWYMGRFFADGIISERREGRYAMYTLTCEAGQVLNSQTGRLNGLVTA